VTVRRLAYYMVVCTLLLVILTNFNGSWSWAHPGVPIDVDL
jgi:hypothetical protein